MTVRARRVAVTSPQTRIALARRHPHAARRGEGPHLPHLGPADLERARRVHREQLRRMVAALAGLALLIIALPVVLAVFPGLDRVTPGGFPLSWLAVGVLPYPVLAGLARWQLRRAERAERPAGEKP